LLPPTPAFAPEGQVIADFEGKDYGDWKTTGEAFGPGPAQGRLGDQNPVDGYLGHGLVNSYYHGDATTGTLTSPEFEITHPYLNFLIGGGSQKETRMDLLLEGKVVRTASGDDAEQLAWTMPPAAGATLMWIKSRWPTRRRIPLPNPRCGLITARIITRPFHGVTFQNPMAAAYGLAG
jgi:hypothetical protein